MSKNSLKLWNCNPKYKNTSDSEESWTCVENNRENFENMDPTESPMFESVNKLKRQLYGTGENANLYFYGSIALIILFIYLLLK
jgi:hypothetical protein